MIHSQFLKPCTRNQGIGSIGIQIIFHEADIQYFWPMIKMITAALVTLATVQGFAQKGYDQYSITDSVRVSTKWSTAKDAEGNKKPAIMIGIDNQNTHAITASMEILFYYEGILRESGQIDPTCVKPGNRVYGKLNGIYFIPDAFTPEQLKNSDFSMQIESITVEEVANCEKE